MLTSADPKSRSRTTTPQSLAELLILVERDRSLDDQRQKRFAGAIRTVCSILGRPPEAVPSALPDVACLLRDLPAPAHGRSRKTLANTRSVLKAAMLRYAGGAKIPPRGTLLRPEWAELKAKLTKLGPRNGLSRLIGLASFQGIAPDAMTDEVFLRMVETVQAINWGRDVLPFERDVPRLWNEAAASIPGWPSVRLRETALPRQPAHLSLSAFPATFQHDVEAHLKWAAGSDPFATDAPARPLKPSSLHLRREQLRIAASTLARALGDPSQIVNLAVLVRPDHVKVILRGYVKPASESGSNVFARGLWMALKAVAKTWVKAPQAQLDELARMQRVLGSQPAGMTKKNRTTLRQFEDPRMLGTFLNLPDLLRKRVKTARLSPRRRLQLTRIALAIDILLVAPMRLQNLSALQLNRQLQWPNGRSGTLYVVLNDNETKNEQALEYPLPDRVRDQLHEYLDRYRPQGNEKRDSWLFADATGVRVPADTLRDGIKKAIKRETGIDMTPHQFRHLAAKIALDANPGAIGLVQNLLGHRNVKTTQNAYAGMRTREAGRFYGDLVSSLRDDSLPAR